MNIDDLFEKYSDEFLKFDRVENKLSKRPDLHAFLLLDSLMPDTRDVISGAEHDVIYLDFDVDSLKASAITEEQIRDLRRCGVCIEDDYLFMFA